VELKRLCLVEHLVAVGAGECSGGGGGEASGVEDGVALVAPGELPDLLHAAEGASSDGGERRGERGRERRRRGRRDGGGRRRGLRVERRRGRDGGSVHGVDVGGPERPARGAAGGAAVTVAMVPAHHRALLGAADGRPARARQAPADADAPLLVLLAGAAAVALLVDVAVLAVCCLGSALAGGCC